MTVNMLKREKKTADWASMLSPHAVDGLSSEEEEEEEEGEEERQSGVCVDTVAHC